MRFIKDFLKWFVIINTGIFLVFTINVMNYDGIRVIYLWEIFGTSAVTSLITTVFLSIDPNKIISKYMQLLIVFLHYACLLGVMLFLGYSFGWIEWDVRGILTMVISVAGVYLCSAVLSTIVGNKDANRMNEALNNIRDI